MIEIIGSWILFSGKQKRINRTRFRVFSTLVVLSALLFGGLFSQNTKAEPPQTMESVLDSGLGSMNVDEMRKGATQGHAAAQTWLGAMYEYGKGVPQDYSQAAFWYRKAADQGYAPAQIYLGTMYATGKGMPQDFSQSTAWFRKAAEQGDAEAQTKLGISYSMGYGVPQDYSQAYMWVNLSASTGFKDGIIVRNMIMKKMTPSQIEEGQKLTREWIAQHPQVHITQ